MKKIIIIGLLVSLILLSGCAHNESIFVCKQICNEVNMEYGRVSAYLLLDVSEQDCYCKTNIESEFANKTKLLYCNS